MSQRHADHAHDQTDVPSEPALRVKALESLLVDKGLVDPAALDVLVETYEHKVGPRNGAQVVTRFFHGQQPDLSWINAGVHTSAHPL